LSPRLAGFKARDVVRVIERLGFVFDRQKGSHAVYVRASDKARVVIPVHAGKDLKPQTLAGIVADIGLSAEEFLRLV
jgi:predicted RNA binding protein YcfA (HicA-like mRNA interferase family)